MAKTIQIYTDGACSGNPGYGGWAGLLLWNGYEREISGAERQTTNNRMELRAAVEALKIVKEPCLIDLYTDSIYLRDGITKWIFAWQANNWHTSAKKPVKNQELWQELLKVKARHEVRWHWVKGHKGHIHNERVDNLARQALKALKSQDDK